MNSTKNLFIGGSIRVVRGQPVEVSENFLRRNYAQLLDLESKGLVEITNNSRRRVLMSDFAPAVVAAAPPAAPSVAPTGTTAAAGGGEPEKKEEEKKEEPPAPPEPTVEEPVVEPAAEPAPEAVPEPELPPVEETVDSPMLIEENPFLDELVPAEAPADTKDDRPSFQRSHSKHRRH
jgi:hypothetical protein